MSQPDHQRGAAPAVGSASRRAAPGSAALAGFVLHAIAGTLGVLCTATLYGAAGDGWVAPALLFGLVGAVVTRRAAADVAAPNRTWLTGCVVLPAAFLAAAGSAQPDDAVVVAVVVAVAAATAAARAR